MSMALAGSRPYFVRAIYDWIVDQGLTPYLLVDADWPDVFVPRAYIEDGRIVLNIKPSAVRDLMLENDAVSFSARFAGKTELIRAPIGSVLGVYARENGEGLFFDVADYPRDPAPHSGAGEAAATSPAAPAAGKPRPALRVVK